MREATASTVAAAARDPLARPSSSPAMLLGVLAVVLFAATLPMTRLAVGPADAPQLPPLFVTAGRAAVAGVLSLLWLLWNRDTTPAAAASHAAAVRAPLRLLRTGAPWRHWRLVLGCALGTVIGFPLFLSLALREVPSMHAAVVTGILPLATAAIAAITLRQRASLPFWACALLGGAVVVAFAAWQGGGHLVLADVWLLLSVLSAAAAYVAGAQLAVALSAERAICWVLVASLPVTVPVALWAWPDRPIADIAASAWAGFAYVSLVSMWLGFFAWYRALALGGTLRVSQVQLLQPFVSLLLAVPLLGEPLEPSTLAFAAAVVGIVWLGKRMPVSPASAATSTSTASATTKTMKTSQAA